MNKRCFRLIFSKSLGFLIPVGELTHSQRKPGQLQATSPAVVSSIKPLRSPRPLVLSLLLAGVPSWTVAEIVVDPIRPSGTHVISAPNGVPVIEIADPNGNGLSHNRFTEFDVQSPGLIYNNSLVNGTSQLGGALLHNPNLSRAARAILTEVTGNNPSSISGSLEVFGGKADLLIAKVSGLLQQQGVSTQVKGYETAVVVNDQGRKQPTMADASDALGKPKLSLETKYPILPSISINKTTLHQKEKPVKPTASINLKPSLSALPPIPNASQTKKPKQQNTKQSLAVLPPISTPYKKAANTTTIQDKIIAPTPTQHENKKQPHIYEETTEILKKFKSLTAQLDKFYPTPSSGFQEPPKSSAADFITSKDLTKAENKAFLDYTSGSNYLLNLKLREGTEPEKNSIAWPLQTGISKLLAGSPDSVAKYFRAFPVDAHLVEGGTIVERGFMSTTTDIEIARKFLDSDSSETIIFSTPGAEISKFSTLPHEQEVLHDRNKSLDLLFKSFDESSKDSKYVFAQSDLPAMAGKKYSMDLLTSTKNQALAESPKATITQLKENIHSIILQLNASATNSTTIATPTIIDHEWKKISDAQGSNPGGLYTNNKGEKWYVKESPSDAHAYNEILANKLYNAASIDVPEIIPILHNGKLGIATRYIEGLQQLSSPELKKMPGVKPGFAVDAWLANWDVAGLLNDNLLGNAGNAIRVDTGGALEYRAGNKPKNERFTTDSVPEFFTLRDRMINPAAARVFGEMTPAELSLSINHVSNVSDKTICFLCDAWGGDNPAHNKELAAKLISRKAVLEKIKEGLKPTTPPDSGAENAPVPK